MTLSGLQQHLDHAPAAPRQPVMFIGHGSPMNILRDNAFTRHLAELGARLEKPRAALVISAHWLTPGETRVSVNPGPPTIHDFGGFPRELYEERYPAQGHPELARQVAREVRSVRVHEDHEMGLDHGAWSLLRHLWPAADVPVFQMSLDYAKPPAFHLETGRELRRLRDQGLLILGSGNIVHNLRRISWEENDPHTPDWALEFDAWARDRLLAGDHTALVDYARQPSARLAVPTSDHYLPMLPILGLLEQGEGVRFTHQSFQNSSISMRCFESLGPGR